MLQIVGGIAAAGVIAAGATALTGAGVTRTGGAADTWIGGKVTQTVTGAVVTDIDYTFIDNTGANQQLSGIDIDLTGAESKTVVIKPTGGSLQTAVEWYCTGADITSQTYSNVTNAVTVVGGPANADINCITANVGHSAAGYYSGLSGLDITVS
ncbi:hypothetical protein [Paractinoplanes atraurantiacus]|nr:hypothetical protein [Actinoplanes atraurantiacus]